jgi:hypothetical protein
MTAKEEPYWNNKEMKMKNKYSLFILGFGTAVLLSSCLYIPKTYKTFLDTTIPLDQTVTVKFEGEFWLKKWNEINIYSTNNVILPAGNTSFLFDLSFTFSNQNSTTTYRMEDIELRYLFEQGKKYTVKSKSKLLGLFKGYEFYVELYDTTDKSVLLKEWKIGQS